MATKLLLHRTAVNGIGTFFDMDTTRGGSGFTTGVVNTAASGTEIQWTRTAAGTVLEWISGRSPTGGWTLSGTMTFNIWPIESNMSANIGARARVFKRTAAGTVTEVGGGPYSQGVEFGTVNGAVANWTGVPTSTAFAVDDRLIVRFYITNIGTMAAGFTGTFDYDGTIAAADGDTWLQINETVTFTPEAQAVTGATIASTAYFEGLMASNGVPEGATNGSTILFGDPGYNFGQTVSGHSGTLTAVSLVVAKSGSPTDALYVEVRDSTVNGTLLAQSQQIIASGVSADPTYAWIRFTLASSIVLSAGTTYWVKVILTRSAQDLTNRWALRSSAGNQYAGGETKDSAGAQFLTGSDLLFGLYGPSTSSVGIRVTYDQSVTTTTITAGSSANAPSVAQAVSGQTIYSTARVFYTETLLFENGTHSTSLTMAAAGRNFSQTITGHAGVLTSVSLRAGRFGAGTPADALYLEVRASTFNGTLLATSLPVALSTIPTFTLAWINWMLPSGVVLTTGTTYWIEVYFTRAAQDNANSVNFDMSSGDAYPAGEVKDSTGSPAFAGNDLSFRLYTGTSHTVANAAAGQAVTGVTIAAGAAATAPTVSPDQTILGATIGGAALPAPLAYWPLNENTGTTAADASGNSHTATLVSATWNTSQKKFGAAALSNAGSARGASFSPISLGTTHSIAYWINGWDGSTAGIFLGGAATFYAGYIDSTDVYYSVGASNYLAWLHGTVTGSHHLVFVRTGASMDLYIDGVFIATQSLLTNTAQTLGSLLSYDDGTFPITATIDDVRLYNVALTSTEVATLYALNPDTAVGGATLFAPTVAIGTSTQTITGATLSSTAALTAPVVTYIALGATIAPTSGTFPPAVAYRILGDTIDSLLLTFRPSVVAGAVTIAGVTVASTAQVFAATVTPGAVTVTGATLASSQQLFAPSLAVGPVAVLAPTRLSTAQVFTATVSTGPVTVVGATLASSQQLFAATVVPGAVTILGATCATTQQLFAPTLSVGPVTILGATVASTATLFQPSVTNLAVGSIGGQTVTSTATLFPPAVVGGLATILAPTLSSTATLFQPSVVALAAEVGTVFIGSAATPRPPSVAPGAVTVVLAFRSSTLTVAPPSLVQVVLAAFRDTTAIANPPSLTVGPVTVTTATIPVGNTRFAPIVANQLSAFTIGSTSQVFPPSLATLTPILLSSIASTTLLFPATVGTLTGVSTGPRTTTIVLFAPAITTSTGVGPTPITSHVVLYPPTVRLTFTILTPQLGPATLLRAPTVGTLTFVLGSTIVDADALYPPTIVLRLPPVKVCDGPFPIDSDRFVPGTH